MRCRGLDGLDGLDEQLGREARGGSVLARWAQRSFVALGNHVAVPRVENTTSLASLERPDALDQKLCRRVGLVGKHVGVADVLVAPHA